MRNLDKKLEIRYSPAEIVVVMGLFSNGGYGEKVITGVCGTSVTGSIPVSRPITKPPTSVGGFVIVCQRGANPSGSMRE